MSNTKSIAEHFAEQAQAGLRPIWSMSHTATLGCGGGGGTFAPDPPRTHVTYEPKAGDYLECEHGDTCCWQRWDGVSSLEAEVGKDGEQDRHALTVLSRAPKQEPEVRTVEVLPSVEKLARALFDSDLEVFEYVRSRSDSTICTPSTIGISRTRSDRAFDTCWRIDDQGFKTKALARAASILCRLDGPALTPVDSFLKTSPNGTVTVQGPVTVIRE